MFEVSARIEEIVTTLLKKFAGVVRILDYYFEIDADKELMMEYVTARLMYEISKSKEKKPQGEDAAMVSQQSKVGNPPSRQSKRTCFYCGQPGYIA